MENLKQQTSDWVKYVQSSEKSLSDTKSVFHNLNNKMKNTEVMNPANAYATDKYTKLAESTASSGSAPFSLAEGMQTIVNLCRLKSEFNALDPDGNGDMEHFLAFTDEISGVPGLTLQWAESTEVHQKSESANEIISSFVNAFRGIANADLGEIADSVASLTEASLSYAETTQRESNFTQNILECGDDIVYFNLYASVFEIYAEDDKGTITYTASYTLNQASYSLSATVWDFMKDSFEDVLKEVLDDWLESMTTPEKEGSKIRVSCLA